MAKNVPDNRNGFSLIEIVVGVGIFAMLVQSAFLIGIPEYKSYVLNTEKKLFTDALLESRSHAMATGKNYGIRAWATGYCAVDSLDTTACAAPSYYLPVGISFDGPSHGVFSAQGLFLNTDPESTSTIVRIGNGVVTREINIDQYGFIDGR